jgi:hypothetical protein
MTRTFYGKGSILIVKQAPSPEELFQMLKFLRDCYDGPAKLIWDLKCRYQQRKEEVYGQQDPS